MEGHAQSLVVVRQDIILFVNLLVARFIIRLLFALEGLLLLRFLRCLNWTGTLPVITRTDTTLVDTMKDCIVAAIDGTF